jgi:hypothetical protein
MPTALGEPHLAQITPTWYQSHRDLLAGFCHGQFNAQVPSYTAATATTDFVVGPLRFHCRQYPAHPGFRSLSTELASESTIFKAPQVVAVGQWHDAGRVNETGQ